MIKRQYHCKKGMLEGRAVIQRWENIWGLHKSDYLLSLPNTEDSHNFYCEMEGGIRKEDAATFLPNYT